MGLHFSASGRIASLRKEQKILAKMQLLCAVTVAVCASLVHGGTLMQELSALPNTKIVRDLLNATGLEVAIDKDYLTLFAPSDDAFAALPDEAAKTVLGNATILTYVLKYHATHGIFRSMDAANNMMIKTLLDGSDIRVNVYNHNTLKAVIDGQNLQDFFKTTTGTLFAPTDAAFKVTNDILVAKGFNTNDTVAVKEFIMYHLLEQVVYSAGGRAGPYTTYDHGATLTVAVPGDGTVMINQAKVVIGDLAASNGVVHVIDSVLVPEPYASALILG